MMENDYNRLEELSVSLPQLIEVSRGHIAQKELERMLHSRRVLMLGKPYRISFDRPWRDNPDWENMSSISQIHEIEYVEEWLEKVAYELGWARGDCERLEEELLGRMPVDLTPFMGVVKDGVFIPDAEVNKGRQLKKGNARKGGLRRRANNGDNQDRGQ